MRIATSVLHVVGQRYVATSVLHEAAHVLRSARDVVRIEYVLVEESSRVDRHGGGGRHRDKVHLPHVEQVEGVLMRPLCE